MYGWLVLEKDLLSGRVGLFGVSFDPLPSKEALLIKRAYMQAKTIGNIVCPNYSDPYDFFSDKLPQAISRKCDFLGKILIPTWLQPKPEFTDANKLTLDSLSRFISSGGCLTVANRVRGFFIKNVFPRIPGMIGVDHSSTYGAIAALTEYKEEPLGLVVLDSHFDAVPATLRYGLMEYAKETNSPMIPLDLFSQSVPPSSSLFGIKKWDKLNAENFLLHILDSKLIDPKNLVVVGIADYPSKAFEEIDDPRVRDYLSFFKSLEEAGTCFISASSLREYGTKRALEKVLEGLNTRRIYVSLDIDIGSLSSTYACRVLNTIGLSFDEIKEIFQSLFGFFSDGFALAGFDLMEIDIHKLGAKIDSAHVDQTSEIGRLFLDLVGKVV